MAEWRERLDALIEARFEALRALRRHLHAHPEISGDEYETSRYLVHRLAAEGVAGRLAPGGRGVIADSGGTGGKMVALRADIDALPLSDAKEVEYRSTRSGVAHACGHDAHAAMLFGAVVALGALRDVLPSPVRWRALFQPAEETSRGAMELIEAGALSDVDAIVGLHVDPERDTARVGVRDGVVTAASEELHVTIRGEGGHAARPHHTVDPIALASQFITSVYQFAPRSIDSREPAVVSFGSISGGTAGNVIPDEVHIRGTIRTLSQATALILKDRIGSIGHALAQAGGGDFTIRFFPSAGMVINDPIVTGVCRRAAAEVVGEAGIEPVSLPSMGGEDFAAYLTFAPGCLLRLGVAGDVRTRHFLHSPLFDIDERALAIGAKILARCAVLLCEPTP